MKEILLKAIEYVGYFAVGFVFGCFWSKNKKGDE